MKWEIAHEVHTGKNGSKISESQPAHNLHMPTLLQLPSGKWRVQVRRNGLYRAATFEKKQAAKDWAASVESMLISAPGGARLVPPKDTLVADLIDSYRQHYKKDFGKTKNATLNMLRRELGEIRLAALGEKVLGAFVDRRLNQGAGGVTVAADLSFLSAVLKWARHARHLDVNERLALDARATLKYRGVETRSLSRDREPTDAELRRLYAHWEANERMDLDMPMLCRFALATGMRVGEICRLDIEDINREARTVVIRDRKDPRNKKGNDQTVPLLPAAWQIVAPIIKDRDGGRVFKANAASVSTAFTRACQNVEPPIVDLRFHDLRHRATREFFRMGLDIPRVALMTGHKTWAQLRRYTAIQPQDVLDAINRNGVRRTSARRRKAPPHHPPA